MYISFDGEENVGAWEMFCTFITHCVMGISHVVNIWDLELSEFIPVVLKFWDTSNHEYYIF